MNIRISDQYLWTRHFMQKLTEETRLLRTHFVYGQVSRASDQDASMPRESTLSPSWALSSWSEVIDLIVSVSLTVTTVSHRTKLESN